jgi:hypothetical protein
MLRGYNLIVVSVARRDVETYSSLCGSSTQSVYLRMDRRNVDMAYMTAQPKLDDPDATDSRVNRSWRGDGCGAESTVFQFRARLANCARAT